MQLYDTRTQQTVALEFPDDTVRMYVCGVTPYDTSHLGHARVAVVYDTLRRFLEWTGRRVRYVQNVTDIDEPLFERAARDGVDWRDLGEQQTARYLAALARINVPKPEFYVKATETIPEMIPLIGKLVEQGHAYVVDGSVYYDNRSFPAFGELAHLPDRAAMLAAANEMGNKPDDPKKRDPLDFVLWQPSAEGEPAWDSPWGAGRPGWHIECSTMAMHHLGPQLDIHGGGADLIFPHHACEIAQAEPVTGVHPYVRAWMHTGLVSMGGTKMSKSLGNMVFVDDILKDHSPNALRLAILDQHYRAPYEWDPTDIVRAEAQAARITDVQALNTPGGTPVKTEGVSTRFRAALEDDFNTPAAIGILTDLAGQIEQGAAQGEQIRPAQSLLRELAGVLGLTF
jgi:L-cysteine:1D-myo-inositol 2-amino-2-deoxy-alpha-D-glucopyranoside ligase